MRGKTARKAVWLFRRNERKDAKVQGRKGRSGRCSTIHSVRGLWHKTRGQSPSFQLSRIPITAWLPFSTGALAGGVRGGGDEGEDRA